MNCPKCGNPLAQDTKFCAKCGTPVPVAQPAVAAPVAPSQPVATPKAKKQKSNDGKKKNLGLKITAAVLVVAVLICGIYSAVFGIKNSNETKGDGVTYISDFPVLKNETEFMVYDEETFPAERYEIKVERFLLGGVLKSVSSRSEEFTRTSSDRIYDLSLENGEYRITLTDITATRTQESSADKQENTTASTTVIIDVTVDNDNPEALGKVTLDSKPGDKTQENNTATSSDFIEATDEDFDELKKQLNSTNLKYGDNYNCETATTQDIIDKYISSALGIDGFVYFFGDDTKEYYENVERYQGKGPDPLGKFTPAYADYYSYYKLPVSDVKWICENIFNITFEPDYVSEHSYVHEDYCYRSYIEAGDGGIYYCEPGDHSVNADGKYEIVVKNYSKGFEDTDIPELLSTKKVTAEIKESDGKRYWSIYKIEDYTPSSEPSQDTPAAKDMYDENLKTYDAYLKSGELGKSLETGSMIDKANSLDFSYCMIDINEDGTYELVLRIFDNDWHSSAEFLYSIQDGKVVTLTQEGLSGGSAGGTEILIKYDNTEKRHTVFIEGHGRDGYALWYGWERPVEYDGKTFSKDNLYQSESYSTEQDSYYKDEIDKIKSETSLHYIDEENQRLLVYKLNDVYISQEDYDKAITNRFTNPTDSKYEMKSGGSLSNPLGL